MVHTQVLPVPVEGPVYFVSYGGAKFPEAVLVLKGDGVTIDLHGETFIAKNGITSAAFPSTPDVPFESIEVNVPEGPYSEFASNVNTCTTKVTMPRAFVAQNGLEIHQNTKIGVNGCPKGLTKAQKLAKALEACNKKHGKRRATCERAARRAYGAKASAKRR